MKKNLLLVLITLMPFVALYAQSPESMNYQCVVRDISGAVMPAQSVSFQFSIIEDIGAGQTVVYTELHNVVTNSFGLAIMAIGSGSASFGIFSDINWSSGMHFLKVEMDVTGGSLYADMGTVQLISVPYALYAKSAGNSFSGSYNDLTNQPDFTGWDQNESNDFAGNYYDLTNKPVLNGDVNGQIESNTVEGIQGRGISTNIPSNGQVLKWNNVSQKWEPSDDQLGAAGTTDGVVTGASFSGTTDKTLTLIRSNGLGDITAVFTDLVDDADADPANELQNLSISGSDLTISNGNTVTIPGSSYTAGAGIDIQGNEIINLAPDQNVTLSGTGSTTVTGTYPNFTINSAAGNYTAGTGIDITTNTITNTAPDQTVTLDNGTGISVSGAYPDFTITNTQPGQTVTITGSGATNVSGVYPNFTISSTDNNTEYTSGNGINIQSNQIINTMPDQEVSISDGAGISVSGSYPDFTITNTNPDQLINLSGSGATSVSGTYPNFTINSTDNNTTYTAGTGIDIQGTEIINTAPNQPVAITGAGATSVSGTYPNYTISSTDNNTTYTAGTGINISGINQISNTAPDQTVFLNGTGATTVSGTYPSFTINSTDNNTTYSAGTGMTLSGTTFNAQTTNALWNANQLQSVAVNSAAPSNGQVLKYNGTSWAPGTDNNTTYSASTGLTLTGTSFSHNAHTGDATGATALIVTGIQGRQVTSNLPANGQILKWNTTNTRWELGDDELGAAGTNDGVVTSIGVSGTTTKTITLTRSQSLPDLTATFTDEGSVYTAGSGISIASNVITNAAPDQTVSLTQGGATTISGTYPNFTISSANTTYTAGTGMTLSGTTFNAQTSNALWNANQIQSVNVSSTAPATDQILKYDGSSWAPAADNNTTYTAGTGISINGSNQISNTLPDQTITLLQGGATTITGTYPVFTISSTDNNSGGTVTSITANNGITATPFNPITTTGTLGLTGQAYALHTLGTNGIIVRTGAGAVTSRTITAGSGITITNGDGVSGNPTISPTFGTTAGTISQGNHTHATLTRGTGLTGSNYDGSTATTWAVNFGTTAGTVSEGNHLHGSYTAAGTTGMIQYNNAGAFGANSNLFWDITNGRLGVGLNNPNCRMVVKGSSTAPINEPLFEVKNSSGQTVFIIYPDSVRIYIDDDPAKTNRGAFAVSGRNTAKALTHDFFVVSPDSSRVYTTDQAAGFGVRNINGTADESYMQMNPNNYFIGHFAGNAITTGLYNSFMGYRSGYNNSDGSNNVFMGYYTGYGNTSGASNVFLGNRAGYSNGAGGSNVFLGNYAGYANTASNNVFVGYYSGRYNTTGDNNAFMGYYSGRSNTTGLSNVFIGNNAGYTNTTASYNVFLGYYAGYTNNANNNVFLGYESGRLNSSGANNAFVGYQAGKANTTGNSNVFIGEQSGLSNTTGYYNVFVGQWAGRYNISGLLNTYMGELTGENATGTENTYLGAEAGRSNTGSNNVCIGNRSGYSNTGSSNVFIGYGAGANSGTASNCMYIHNSNASIPTIYGDFSTKNIGFGTITPGSHRIYATSSATTTTGSTGYFVNTAAAGIAFMAENSSTTSSDAAILVTQKGSAGDIMVLDSWHGTGSWDREFRFTNTGNGMCDGSWTGGGADYAEYFIKSDTTLMYEPGDVIQLSDEGNTVKASSNAYSVKVVGVFSTNPVVIGNGSSDGAPDNSVLVGMMGVVPTKVTNENGEIKVGDFLTSSSVSGVAMKADKPCLIIGRAMENYNSNIVGKINVLVNPGWAGNEEQIKEQDERIRKIESENDILKAEIENIKAFIGVTKR